MNGEKLGSCSSHKLEPSTKVLVHFFLGDCSVQVRVFPSVPHLIEDIEVVLDVLQGAVFGEFVQQRLDLLFRGGHLGARIAWRDFGWWFLGGGFGWRSASALR